MFHETQKSRCWLTCLLLLAGCERSEIPTQPAPAEVAPLAAIPPATISLVFWNVESGGNDPSVIAEQLAALDRYDVYCLCEVHADSFSKYANALGSGYVSVSSVTGGGDRLQILFDSNRFEILQQGELHRYGEHELNNDYHRSPLWVRLRERDSGVEFIVMTNHLARRNAELRKSQAIGLREWARDQNVAVINIGDFNLDYDFHTERGNDAFPEMLRDNIWQWVKPVELIDTNWADRGGDGKDDYPDSMLDFAFVAGPAKEWSPTCRVIVRDGDFPDDETTSDHRPVELVVAPN